MLEVTFDNKSKFEKHVTTISNKANRKLNALAIVTPYIDLTKKQMFYSRALNNKINRLHGRCVRIIYNHKTSPFNKLLEKDNSVSTHYRNIEALAISMYEVANRSSH